MSFIILAGSGGKIEVDGTFLASVGKCGRGVTTRVRGRMGRCRLRLRLRLRWFPSVTAWRRWWDGVRGGRGGRVIGIDVDHSFSVDGDLFLTRIG